MVVEADGVGMGCSGRDVMVCDASRGGNGLLRETCDGL